MQSYGLFYQLFSFEIVLLGFLFISIIITRFYHKIRNQRRQKVQDSFRRLFREALAKDSLLEKALPWSPLLIPVIEEFDHRFQGGGWSRIKEQLATPSFFQKVHSYAQAKSWYKRNLAARVFAALPHKDNEEFLLNLLKDDNFLVYSFAAKAIVMLENEKGIRLILTKQTKLIGYPHFALKDILLTGSQKTFAYIIELGKDPLLRKEVLDILGLRFVPLPIPYLKESLEEGNPEMRLLALKALVRNPQRDALSYLPKALEERDPDIRLEALQGLNSLAWSDAKPLLIRMLNDPVWKVRLAAAKMLKKNEEGLKILEEQQVQNRQVRETVQYALQFG